MRETGRLVLVSIIRILTGGLMLLLIFTCAQPPAEETPGADLAVRLGCLACHSLKGQGGTMAAPLDGVGTRFSREELQMLIEFPRRFYPRAKMPSYAYLPLPERQVLAQFLEAIK